MSLPVRTFLDGARNRTTRWPGALAIATLTLVGCATGSRAELVASASTGSADLDDLIARIDDIDAAVFAASYEVRLPFDGSTHEVTTTQAAADRRSLTIGDVRFLVDDATPETCTLSSGACRPGHDAARVSDVQMTNDFFGTSLVARLRRDAALATGPVVATDEAFEGSDARCARIPLPAAPATPDEPSSATYCVFANGVLARLVAADIEVTLTAYDTEADESQFETRAPRD